MAFYASHGIQIRRVLSDNGGCYRSRLFLDVLQAHEIAERKTKPLPPQTNGKAEAMVKILSNSCAYVGLNGHDRSTGSVNDARGNYS